VITETSFIEQIKKEVEARTYTGFCAFYNVHPTTLNRALKEGKFPKSFCIKLGFERTTIFNELKKTEAK
jgi:hypothetical protein